MTVKVISTYLRSLFCVKDLPQRGHLSECMVVLGPRKLPEPPLSASWFAFSKRGGIGCDEPILRLGNRFGADTEVLGEGSSLMETGRNTSVSESVSLLVEDGSDWDEDEYGREFWNIWESSSDSSLLV